MATMQYKITEIGILFVIIYCLNQLLIFFGLSVETYAVYIAFYMFILISKVVLPEKIGNL